MAFQLRGSSSHVRRAFTGIRPSGVRFMATTKANIAGYGSHSFSGAVADEYLTAAGLPCGTMNDHKWTFDPAATDKVAEAVLNWAVENGATSFCHWFQVA